MEKLLASKKILIVEDEIVFRSVLTGYLSSLGASIYQAVNGREALGLLDLHSLDLILCDISMPEMGGIEFVECLSIQSIKIPVLIISATNKMTDIAQVLRMGAKDVLLKPIVNLARLREAVLECLYAEFFTSPALERREFNQDWDELRKNPQKAAQLLLQLQPPVQQKIAQCNINYQQLTMVEQPGLVLDIATLSTDELAFYCLDITKAKENGVLAALLLRVLFNGILQEHLVQKKQRLPQMTALLQKLNQLLRCTHLDGQFPLLLGYYHSKHKNLSLISAGLRANITVDKNKIQLSNGMPLGTLNVAYLNKISQHCCAWECKISGGGSRLRLMLSTE